MKVGIAQLAIDPLPERVKDNRRQAAAVIGRLFDAGADLVLLPELSHLGYFPPSPQVMATLSEDLGGESVTLWHDLARQYQGYIVGGMLERGADGIYNAAVLVGPGGIVATYRKVHLFDWEKTWLLPGNRWVTAYLKDLDVTVGLLICYDLRFPEAVRRLAMMGADVVLVPTTWTSVGKPLLWDVQGYCLQNHVAIAHAYCHRLAMVCADRVGSENGITFLGASIAVEPSGMVAAGPLPGTSPAEKVVAVDEKAAREKGVGRFNHLIDDRRVELYRADWQR